MGCNCSQYEIEQMERHFDRQVDQLEARIERLRQALKDTGLDWKTIAILENGK